MVKEAGPVKVDKGTSWDTFVSQAKKGRFVKSDGSYGTINPISKFVRDYIFPIFARIFNVWNSYQTCLAATLDSKHEIVAIAVKTSVTNDDIAKGKGLFFVAKKIEVLWNFHVIRDAAAADGARASGAGEASAADEEKKDAPVNSKKPKEDVDVEDKAAPAAASSGVVDALASAASAAVDIVKDVIGDIIPFKANPTTQFTRDYTKILTNSKTSEADKLEALKGLRTKIAEKQVENDLTQDERASLELLSREIDVTIHNYERKAKLEADILPEKEVSKIKEDIKEYDIKINARLSTKKVKEKAKTDKKDAEAKLKAHEDNKTALDQLVEALTKLPVDDVNKFIQRIKEKATAFAGIDLSAEKAVLAHKLEELKVLFEDFQFIKTLIKTEKDLLKGIDKSYEGVKEDLAILHDRIHERLEKNIFSDLSSSIKTTFLELVFNIHDKVQDDLNRLSTRVKTTKADFAKNNFFGSSHVVVHGVDKKLTQISKFVKQKSELTTKLAELQNQIKIAKDAVTDLEGKKGGKHRVFHNSGLNKQIKGHKKTIDNAEKEIANIQQELAKIDGQLADFNINTFNAEFNVLKSSVAAIQGSKVANRDKAKLLNETKSTQVDHLAKLAAKLDAEKGKEALENFNKLKDSIDKDIADLGKIADIQRSIAESEKAKLELQNALSGNAFKSMRGIDTSRFADFAKDTNALRTKCDELEKAFEDRKSELAKTLVDAKKQNATDADSEDEADATPSPADDEKAPVAAAAAAAAK